MLTLILSVLAQSPVVIWTPEQAAQYCMEERQRSGRTACELPRGVVVKNPKD